MDEMSSALEKARAFAANAGRDGGTPIGDDAIRAASMWAQISIAESLASIDEDGVEIYELDSDGHRRYR